MQPTCWRYTPTIATSTTIPRGALSAPSRSRPIAGAISPRSASRRPLSSSGTHTILRSPSAMRCSSTSLVSAIRMPTPVRSPKPSYAAPTQCSSWRMSSAKPMLPRRQPPTMACLILPSLRSILGVPSIIEARSKRSTSTLSKTSPRACRISIQQTTVSRSTTSLHRLLMPSLRASTSMPVSMPRLLSTLMPLWDQTHAPTYVTGLRGASRGSQAMYSLTPISSLLSRRISSCRR